MKKRKQGRQARFRFSALNSKVPVVGVSSVKSRIPHTTRRDTAVNTRLSRRRSCESHVDPEARVPPGQDSPGASIRLGYLISTWAPSASSLVLICSASTFDTSL